MCNIHPPYRHERRYARTRAQHANTYTHAHAHTNAYSRRMVETESLHQCTQCNVAEICFTEMSQIYDEINNLLYANERIKYRTFVMTKLSTLHMRACALPPELQPVAPKLRISILAISFGTIVSRHHAYRIISWQNRILTVCEPANSCR